MSSQGSLEDEEVLWINSATWNDSLWIAGNNTLELNDGGYFFDGQTSKLDNLPSILDRNGNDKDISISTWLKDIDDYDFENSMADDLLQEDFVSGNIYENYTDDVKLTLVNTLRKRNALASKAPKENQTICEKTAYQKIKSCCDHNYTFRSKHEFLRRSSPRSSSPSISRSSSASSVPNTSRQSRSLSPQLLRKSVETYQRDLNKSRIYRDCCNRSYQPCASSPAHIRTAFSPHSGSLVNGSHSAYGQNISPLVSNGSKMKESYRETLSKYANDDCSLVLDRDLFYGRGFQMTRRHSIISIANGNHSPQSESCESSQKHCRSNSVGSFENLTYRKSRSLSPHLFQSVNAHQIDFCKRKIYRDCLQQHHHSEKCNNKKQSCDHVCSINSPRVVGVSTDSSLNSTMSPTETRSKLHMHREVNAVHANHSTTASCYRTCCQQQYKKRPKFNYLKKGKGIKNHLYLSPTTSNGERFRELQNAQSSHTVQISLPSQTDHVPNSPMYHLGMLSSAPQFNDLPRNCTSQSHQDIPDGQLMGDHALVCDEVLLEFPSIYYKLDCSEQDGDTELESRKAKAGTVYRILDDGSVVIDSNSNLSDGQTTKSGG